MYWEKKASKIMIVRQMSFQPDGFSESERATTQVKTRAFRAGTGFTFFVLSFGRYFDTQTLIDNRACMGLIRIHGRAYGISSPVSVKGAH